jgi:6-phosphogluconate dehydrogenase
METILNEIGVIGAGVMGGNLALNFANKGLGVPIYDRSPAAIDSFASQLAAAPVSVHSDLKMFLIRIVRPLPKRVGTDSESVRSTWIASCCINCGTNAL